jgi:ribosomal protein S18 acetylase RimI-like enzyme
MSDVVSRTVALELTARGIRAEDLAGLSSWLSPLHVRQVAAAMRREPPGSKDFLAVFASANGASVAKGEVNYRSRPGMGEIGSLAVRADVQSLGIGTFLIEVLEQRIRAHGLAAAMLSVEDNNPRARALYERLGYVAYDREPDSWDQQTEDGVVYRYETICTLLRKELNRP